MLERALEHVREDLHVAVAVRAEPRARRDAVVVDHAERAEAHVLVVVVLAGRERVPAVEPAPVGAAPVLGGSNLDHGVPPGAPGPSSHFDGGQAESLQGARYHIMLDVA